MKEIPYQEDKQNFVPDPGVTNTPILHNIFFDSFHKPRSPFGYVSLDFPRPEIACGTQHLILLGLHGDGNRFSLTRCFLWAYQTMPSETK